MQTLEDAAAAWMLTAGSIMCTPSLCRNERITEIKGTLFYKDPTYMPVAITAKHVNNNMTLYSDVLSIDWGRKSSDLRDDDAKIVGKVVRCLLTSQVKGTPSLFAGMEQPFSATEVNSFLGFKSMSEKAKVWCAGGWWHHKVSDGVHRLLSEGPPDLDEEHRVTEHDDYAPYGKPEQIEVDEGLTAEGTDTESDSSDAGMSQSPSLGAYMGVLAMYTHRHEGIPDM